MGLFGNAEIIAYENNCFRSNYPRGTS